MNKFAFRYGVLVVLSVIAVFAVSHFGALFHPTSPDVHVITAPESHVLFAALCSLLAVILITRAVGSVLVFFEQPRVIGDILGGIVLGPSVLGAVAPDASKILFPASSISFLSTVSQVGILLFMFLVGLELDLTKIKRAGRSAILIAHASIVLPFLLGMGLAIILYTEFAPPGIPYQSFALFIGVSMAVTAFPVLARILGETGLNRTSVGTLSLACAAIDDATAWCLLALVVGLMQNSVNQSVATVVLTVVYASFMLLVARPFLKRMMPRLEGDSGSISEGAVALILTALLVSAVTTEFIGIHALFGSFLLGAIIPHESQVAHDMEERIGSLVRMLFLPAFFAFTGLRTQIGLIDGWHDWAICATIIVAAVGGKFGGAYIAGRISGLGPKESAVIGALMNTRGLVELIVLNAGLDYGVLSPKLFTILVIMAVTTTLLTGPWLRLLKASDFLHEKGTVVPLRHA